MSNENSIIQVNNTSYNIEEDWLEIAKKYFNIDSDDTKRISLLKAGLFGYLNEISSNEIKNNVYHRNVLYDEHFLNTASIPKSIYNFAKMLNYDIDLAIPASLSINLSLSKSKILNSSKIKKINVNDFNDSDATYSYTIDQDTEFTVKNYNFRLPYPVQLLFKYTPVNKGYSVTARYLHDENDFMFYSDNSPYIKTWESDYNGERYIFLKLQIFQLNRLESEILVNSEDSNEASNLFHTVTFTDQLAYFDVYYDDGKETHKLNKYFNNTFTPDDDYFCYYNLSDDNKLEISFSSLPNSFRPAYNSHLKFVLYTTNGNEGNFDYINEISLNFNRDDELDSIPMLITPITESSGGSNKLSFTKIKENLIKKYLSRNNIITDFDLDNFFNEINLREKMNDSFIKFIKKRNDVIKRLYSAFLLLKDNNKMVIPTRTISNLVISQKTLNDINFGIPDESVITYNVKTKEYKLIYEKLEIQRYYEDPDYLLFSVPYYLEISNSLLKTSYYKTYVNKDINFNCNYINAEIPFKFILSNFNISRKSYTSEVYTLQLSLSTNLILSSETEKSNLKVRGILKSKSNETYGYFEFNQVSDNDCIYEAKIATDKYNSIKNGQLNIYNSIYKIDDTPQLNNFGDTSVSNCFISPDISLEIQILYKSKYSTKKYSDAISMPDMSDFATACVFKNSDSFSLFKNLSSIINSDVVPSGDNFVIKSIPVVEYSYFINNIDSVYNMLDTYSDLLNVNLENLENNTDVDLKLYNTIGESKWYCTKINHKKDNTTDYTLLDRIDLTLDFNIYINKSISDDDDEAIKNYINSFIEGSNEESVLPISNLIRQLENNFEIIKYIEYNTTNNVLTTQKIDKKFENIKELSKQEIQDYVPEYLNLRKKISVVSETKENVYKYEVKLNYL